MWFVNKNWKLTFKPHHLIIYIYIIYVILVINLLILKITNLIFTVTGKKLIIFVISLSLIRTYFSEWVWERERVSHETEQINTAKKLITSFAKINIFSWIPINKNKRREEQWMSKSKSVYFWRISKCCPKNPFIHPDFNHVFVVWHAVISNFQCLYVFKIA